MSDPTTKLRNRLKALQAAIEGERRNMDGAHVTKTDKIFADCIDLAVALEAPPVSEPVAWMDSGGAVIGAAMKRYKEMSIHIDRRESAKDYTTPLFTHPTKE